MFRSAARLWTLGAVTWLVLSPGGVQAQSRSMFGNASSGATSLGRSSNSSGFSSLTSSSASRGQTGMGQTGFGQTGQTGFGQQSTQFGATTGQRQGLVGQSGAGGRLIGGNQAQQGAVQGNQFGANQFGSNVGLQGLGRRGATGGRGGLGAGFGQGGLGSQGALSTGPRYPNPQLKIGFEPAFTPPAELTLSVTNRIAKVDTAHGIAGVVATADEEEAGTVVLTGTVRTEQLRKKAEHLVRFEPGVREVRNEIVVSADIP
jgi:hypothetical protein